MRLSFRATEGEAVGRRSAEAMVGLHVRRVQLEAAYWSQSVSQVISIDCVKRCPI
jgi:hypothetical protein